MPYYRAVYETVEDNESLIKAKSKEEVRDLVEQDTMAEIRDISIDKITKAEYEEEQ